jgi:ABC-2 type transport system permease protein
MSGTWLLIRLALRLDRVRLPIWIVVIAVSPALTAAQYKQLYPTEQSLRAVAGVLSNPSLVALNGPLFALDIGALTAWKIGVTGFILIALMNILTVVRHTRTEEETGRYELVGAGVVGRYAPLSAALSTVALADIAIAVLTALGLVGTGLPAAGSVAFGLAIGAVGLVFAAVSAATAQLTESGRSATAIASAVLGVTFLLRAVGDTGPTWLSWLSPLGWAMRLRAFAGERWWTLGLAAALVVVLTGAAYTLVARRDLGAGLLPQRPGPAQAADALAGPFALAWRLHRGILVGWLVGMALAGAVLGGAAKGIDTGISANQQLTDLLAKMGGRGALLDAYLGTAFGLIGLTAAAYAVQATLRLRAEETGGRVEPLLATPVGRIRWALSHLVFALAGTVLLLAVAGVAGGLAYGAQIHDVGGQVARLVGAALVQVPAVWVLAAIAVALFGLLPNWSVASWAALVVFLTAGLLGPLLELPQWVMDVSPFTHTPHLPGGTVQATPLVWLSCLVVALTAAGLAGWRRRDVG